LSREAALTDIPLYKPWIDAAETERVSQALQGRLAGDGPICRAVERRLEQLFGAERVLLTSSCTHALELALLALGVGNGHEVICPSFTFASSANAILRAGARPVFADIQESTLSLDPEDVGRRITPRTAAIMPVHYAGIAADMDALRRLAENHDLWIVEDAAHGVGGAYRGRSLGTLGDAGCFSFHETKNITCGEGGALAVRDPEVAKRDEIIREKGTNRSAFLRGEVRRYTWVAEGSSYVLPEPLAAMLDAQLDKLDRIQSRRAEVCARYRAGLWKWAETHGVRLPADLRERASGHHTFYLLYPGVDARNGALHALQAAGILAAFHYVPLHNAPHAQKIGADGARLAVTESVAGRLLRLPLHPRMTEAEVERVIAEVRRFPLPGASR
jgi:dTDP-4-amino-4,6-dideoxygalactose transaminase